MGVEYSIVRGCDARARHQAIALRLDRTQLTSLYLSDYDCCMLRNIILGILIAATSTWMFAADPGAMFYGNDVLRNGAEMANASAIFSGDLLETRADSVANLKALGTNVIILPTSLVEFQGQSLSVEHGSVSVATSHGISVRAGCMMIVPATSAWTQFEVTDVNGTVQVAAKKNDVRLKTVADSGSAKELSASLSSSNLREGEQTSRDDSAGCKSDKRKRDAGGGATPAGSGGVLISNNAKDIALGTIGGVGVYLLLKSDDPPSPWKP